MAALMDNYDSQTRLLHQKGGFHGKVVDEMLFIHEKGALGGEIVVQVSFLHSKVGFRGQTTDATKQVKGRAKRGGR